MHLLISVMISFSLVGCIGEGPLPFSKSSDETSSFTLLDDTSVAFTANPNKDLEIKPQGTSIDGSSMRMSAGSLAIPTDIVFGEAAFSLDSLHSELEMSESMDSASVAVNVEPTEKVNLSSAATLNLPIIAKASLALNTDHYAIAFHTFVFDDEGNKKYSMGVRPLEANQVQNNVATIQVTEWGTFKVVRTQTATSLKRAVVTYQPTSVRTQKVAHQTLGEFKIKVQEIRLSATTRGFDIIGLEVVSPEDLKHCFARAIDVNGLFVPESVESESDPTELKKFHNRPSDETLDFKSHHAHQIRLVLRCRSQTDRIARYEHPTIFKIPQLETLSSGSNSTSSVLAFDSQFRRENQDLYPRTFVVTGSTGSFSVGTKRLEGSCDSSLGDVRVRFVKEYVKEAGNGSFFYPYERSDQQNFAVSCVQNRFEVDVGEGDNVFSLLHLLNAASYSAEVKEFASMLNKGGLPLGSFEIRVAQGTLNSGMKDSTVIFVKERNALIEAVNTKEDLMAALQSSAVKMVVLTSDIDFGLNPADDASRLLVPLHRSLHGGNADANHQIEGQGFRIQNLHLKGRNTTDSYVGLFHQADTSNTSLKRVHWENVSIVGNDSSSQLHYLGFLYGMVTGTSSQALQLYNVEVVQTQGYTTLKSATYTKYCGFLSGKMNESSLEMHQVRMANLTMHCNTSLVEAAGGLAGIIYAASASDQEAALRWVEMNQVNISGYKSVGGLFGYLGGQAKNIFLKNLTTQNVVLSAVDAGSGHGTYFYGSENTPSLQQENVSINGATNPGNVITNN